MMKTTPVKIGKRSFALLYNYAALCRLEELAPDFTLDKAAEMLNRPSGLRVMLLAAIEQGEKEEGRKPDIDLDWLGKHLPIAPVRLVEIQVAAMNALADGLRMETDQDGGDEEHDVVLDEIKKKEPTGG